MKFSELPYVRPDIEALKAEAADFYNTMVNAQSADEQIEAMERYFKTGATVDTMCTLAYTRHTIDTRDEYWDKENDFIDENMPLLRESTQKNENAILESKFRPQLEERFGKLLFTNYEISRRTFTPEMTELIQQENKLCSEYQKLYASAMVEFDGKTMPLPKLGPYKQSPDRAVRRAAYETEGKFFDSHREELDRIYDDMVKNRTAQAKLLGHKNYVQLGYDRMGRNCYDPAKVAQFRDQIARDLVPVVANFKKEQEKKLGVDKLKFWDDTLLLPEGNPKPKGTADDILAAGREMYRQLSPETAEFIDYMIDNDMLDVLSKDGKAPGGYCCNLYDFGTPFIFSNFNGTSGDVDVLTHEAGHGFAAWRAMKKGYITELLSPTIEACECHSMSMEFLTSPYHHLFFGEDTKKYELTHCAESLTFIPYGTLVDEFQTMVYENPDMTPAQRNELWMRLEKKYRPWNDFEDLPFYGRGAGWQRQLHIYLNPMYYIDYCMAQTVAFQFWFAFLKDREDAWKRYLAFVDKGGTQTFEELVRGAGLKVPYDEGCIKEIGQAAEKWLEENRL